MCIFKNPKSSDSQLVAKDGITFHSSQAANITASLLKKLT